MRRRLRRRQWQETPPSPASEGPRRLQNGHNDAFSMRRCLRAMRNLCCTFFFSCCCEDVEGTLTVVCSGSGYPPGYVQRPLLGCFPPKVVPFAQWVQERGSLAERTRERSQLLLLACDDWRKREKKRAISENNLEIKKKSRAVPLNVKAVEMRRSHSPEGRSTLS